MAVLYIGIIFYFLISYFNVFLDKSEVLIETMFYAIDIFENFLSRFTIFILLHLFCIFYGSLYLLNNNYLIRNNQAHKLPNTKKTMIKCPECRYNCSSQYFLREHQKRHTMSFQQQKSSKIKHKRYLMQNISILVIFLLLLWSWSQMQDYESKGILEKKLKLSLSLPILMSRSRSYISNHPYLHTRKTILILLLLCGDIDSMKNPGPAPVPTNQSNTGSDISNGENQNPNIRNCQFCLTAIKKKQ